THRPCAQAFRHRSGQYPSFDLHRQRRISHRRLRHGPGGDALSTSRGVRVTGIDAWGWDVPFLHTRKRWLETHDPSIIWEGHKAGREIPYCHMEKLCNLEQLPAHGFMVACFPYKVKRGSGGWTRAVALFD